MNQVKIKNKTMIKDQLKFILETNLTASYGTVK